MEIKLIKLATYSYSRAEVIRTLLEADGIECFLSNTNLIQPSISQGVEIQVKENDYVPAIKILQNYSQVENREKGLKNIKKILVPIDLTNASRNASYFAFSLAKKFNAQIKFIYSYFIPEYASLPIDETFAYGASVPNYLIDLKYQAEQELQSIKNEFSEYLKCHKMNGIHLSYALETGFSDEIPFLYSKEWKADLIVTGLSKRDETETLFPGIEIEKVINKVDIPLLIIPEYYVFKDLDYFQKIMYTTTYDESDIDSIKKLARLTSSFEAEIHIVHFDNQKSVINNAKMQVLKDYLARISHIAKISYEIIESDNLLIAIDEYIQKFNINILSLIAHKRNLIERLISPDITKKILANARIPLLFFHG